MQLQNMSKISLEEGMENWIEVLFERWFLRSYKTQVKLESSYLINILNTGKNR